MAATASKALLSIVLLNGILATRGIIVNTSELEVVFDPDKLKNSHWSGNAVPKTYLSNSVPGRDYPIFRSVPDTTFRCENQEIFGYYGDMEAYCQVFHICQQDGRVDSFLCPNQTLFNQQLLICDWWYNVRCEETPLYYYINKVVYGNFSNPAYAPARAPARAPPRPPPSPPQVFVEEPDQNGQSVFVEPPTQRPATVGLPPTKRKPVGVGLGLGVQASFTAGKPQNNRPPSGGFDFVGGSTGHRPVAASYPIRPVPLNERPTHRPSSFAFRPSGNNGIRPVSGGYHSRPAVFSPNDDHKPIRPYVWSWDYDHDLLLADQ